MPVSKVTKYASHSTKKKLRRGMLKALKNGQLAQMTSKMALNHIKSHPRGTGEREVLAK